MISLYFAVTDDDWSWVQDLFSLPLWWTLRTNTNNGHQLEEPLTLTCAWSVNTVSFCPCVLGFEGFIQQHHACMIVSIPHQLIDYAIHQHNPTLYHPSKSNTIHPSNPDDFCFQVQPIFFVITLVMMPSAQPVVWVPISKLWSAKFHLFFRSCNLLVHQYSSCVCDRANFVSPIYCGYKSSEESHCQYMAMSIFTLLHSLTHLQQPG